MKGRERECKGRGKRIYSNCLLYTSDAADE